MNYSEIITETETELEELEKKQKLVQFQKRLTFLRLLKSQTASSQREAGESVGWKVRQSQRIWQLYQKGGLSALLRKPQRFGFGELSSQQIAQLQNYLKEFGGDSLSQVCSLIKEMFGVQYTEGGACMFLKRLRIKLKTARPSNQKKEEGAGAAYKKTLAI